MQNTHSSPKPLQKSGEELRHELRGFPAWAVEAAVEYGESGSREALEQAVLGVIEYYVPRETRQELRTLPPETRLREDLGADSLSMTEATFKLEETFDITIDVRELGGVSTLGELQTYLRSQLPTG